MHVGGKKDTMDRKRQMSEESNKGESCMESGVTMHTEQQHVDVNNNEGKNTRRHNQSFLSADIGKQAFWEQCELSGLGQPRGISLSS